MSKKVIVAISGGPDSMALLDLLRRNNIETIVAHVNYRKRESAKRDELIVKNYCDLYNIPLEISYPIKVNKDNFQSWAREVRYDFFASLALKYQTNILFVAHQLDDYIETLIMQINRGSYHSYYGINPKSHYRDMLVLRPLIKYTKEELVNYCLLNNIEYGIDESNLSDDYTRNKIRHSFHLDKKIKINIFKKCEKINLLRNQYLNYIENKYQKNIYTISEYENIIDKDSFLRIKLDKLISKDYLKEIKEELIISENVSFIIKDKEISKEYGYIFVTKKFQDYAFVLEEYTYLDNEYFRLVDYADSFHRATIYESDYPITIRNFKSGDKIKMRYGTKKINRYFIDRKIPKIYRKRWPVVLNSNNEIIFVPGIGSDVAHYSTKPNFFMIEYCNMEDYKDAY